MLEPLSEDDFETVSGWMSDPVDHEKICGNAFPYPLSQEKFVSYFVEGGKDENARLCFKYVKDGKTLGMASFTRIDRKNDFGHIGLATIDPAYRSAGLGEALFKELLDLGFEQLSFNRIDLVVMESNTRALDFYIQKFGFTNEGLVRDIIKVAEGYLSWYTLSLLKREWQADQ